MTRAVAIYLGAALMAAWAILRAWDHFRGRPEPPPWQEPEDGVQPLDPRLVYLVTVGQPTDATPRYGTFSLN